MQGAQQARVTGPGDGRQVDGNAVHTLAGQPGKATGLDGLWRDAQGGGALDAGVGAHSLLDGLHQHGVFGPAAADVDGRGACGADGGCRGFGREGEQGGLDIFGGCLAVPLLVLLQVLLQPRQVEEVATGALGGAQTKIRFGHQGVQQGWDDPPAGGPLPLVVVTFALVVLDPAVQQRVGGASVVAADMDGRAGTCAGIAGDADARGGWRAGICGSGTAVDHRQIGDAAQVQDAEAPWMVCKQVGMEGRHQGGAVAAGGDVGAAQVGHDIDAGALGQARGVEQLQAPVFGRSMTHGLAVGAQGTDAARRQAGLLQQGTDAAGIEIGQCLAGQGGAAQFVVGWVLQGGELLAQGFRHGQEGVAQGGTDVPFGGEGEHDAVNTIHAGAGHQADVDLVIGLGGRG